MRVLISAKAAKQISQENQQTGVDLVLTNITNAANNGLTSVIVDSLSDYVEGILTTPNTDGSVYKVSRIAALNNAGVTISWDEA